MNIFITLFSCCLSFIFPTMTSQSPRHEPCDFSTYIVVELLASVSVAGNYQLSCSFVRQKQISKNNTSINYHCLLLWVCQFIYLTIVSSVRSVLIIVNYASTIGLSQLKHPYYGLITIRSLYHPASCFQRLHIWDISYFPRKFVVTRKHFLKIFVKI